jgi:beta-mannanase
MSGRRAACLAALACLAMTAAAAPSAAAGGQGIALGTYIPGVAWHPGQIDRYSRLMGRVPAIVSDYKQWDVPAFERRELMAIWSRGSVPMITWEPMSYHGRSYPLRAIARGRYDGYVRRSARAARDWGRPILLRFAHEMNGDWYPWGVRGNSPHDYKAAWRHVVRVFRRAGADNVQWIWAPNVDQGGDHPFAGLFPGNRWVDWVGLDGFNWGYDGSFYSFRRIFGHSYRVLGRLSRRPVMIAETGAGAAGKARWISQALRWQMPRFGRIRALVWFNYNANGVNLRFDTPAPALRAFRAAAREPRYALSREAFLAPLLP